VASIYARQPLNPRQLITVAQRRFDDAEVLYQTGKNRHANGALYLGDFVIELLLKAQLLRRWEKLGRVCTDELKPDERPIWHLLHRSHDLKEILDRMPDVEAMIEKRGQRDGQQYRTHLRQICSEWTIFARYSPHQTTVAQARVWLDRIRALKEVLR
jgi:hypothetical protein